MKRTMMICGFAACTVFSAFGANASNGKVVYDAKCKSCHGADGTPNASVAKMMKVEIKDLKSSDVQSMSEGDLKKVITDGKGKMRPIKTVSGTDLDDVVAYVKSMKK